LQLADFDVPVMAIAAQPFLVTARVGAQLRRHVPDFLLLNSDGSVTEDVLGICRNGRSVTGAGFA
jgi:hypothetical protein